MATTKDIFASNIQAVSPERFFAATGNDSFPLAFGSKGTRVKQLQQSLVLLGASIPAGATGNFGSQTKSALKSLGYSTTVGESDFKAIVSKATAKAAGMLDTGTGTTTISEADLKALWQKYRNAGGKLAYEDWLKREQRRTKWKDFGKGLFQVGLEWFRQKQTGYPDEGVEPIDLSRDTDKIWGMPKAVVYIGGTVLAGLAIWGIVSLATRRRPAAVDTRAIPVVQP